MTFQAVLDLLREDIDHEHICKQELWCPPLRMTLDETEARRISLAQARSINQLVALLSSIRLCRDVPKRVPGEPVRLMISYTWGPFVRFSHAVRSNFFLLISLGLILWL
jgi:hypothetical protein